MSSSADYPNVPRAVRESVRQISSLSLEAMSTPTTLDMPRRIFHPVTGMPSLTSLFREVAALVDEHRELTIAYVHMPTSEIVEDRYGWETHEAYTGMVRTTCRGRPRPWRARGAVGCCCTPLPTTTWCLFPTKMATISSR